MRTRSSAREHHPVGWSRCLSVWLQLESTVHLPRSTRVHLRTSVGAYLELLGTLHLVLNPPAEERVAHDVTICVTESASLAQLVDQLVLVGGEPYLVARFLDRIDAPLRDVALVTLQLARRLDLLHLEVRRGALVLELPALRLEPLRLFLVSGLEYLELQWLQLKIGRGEHVGTTDVGHGQGVDLSDQLDIITLLSHEALDVELALVVDARVHPEVKGVVHIVRREPILALGLGEDVVAVGVVVKPVLVLIEEGAAPRVIDVVGTDRVRDDRK